MPGDLQPLMTDGWFLYLLPYATRQHQGQTQNVNTGDGNLLLEARQSLAYGDPNVPVGQISSAFKSLCNASSYVFKKRRSFSRLLAAFDATM